MFNGYDIPQTDWGCHVKYTEKSKRNIVEGALFFAEKFPNEDKEERRNVNRKSKAGDPDIGRIIEEKNNVNQRTADDTEPFLRMLSAFFEQGIKFMQSKYDQ